MAVQTRTGGHIYSGVTTTTDSDTLTMGGKFSGGNGALFKKAAYFRVTNRHASLNLYVRVDGTAPVATAPVAAGTVPVAVLPAGATEDIPVEKITATGAEIQLISTAACDYRVILRNA